MRGNFAVALACIVFSCGCCSGQSLTPIGQWTDHLPYHQVIGIAEDNGIIRAFTPYSFFSVDVQSKTIERLSKLSGLSDAGIGAFCLDKNSGKLVIGYSNGNIDVLYRNDVYNINAFKFFAVGKQMLINHISVNGNEAFVSTSLGIIVIDLNRYEIKQTCIIGNNGDSVTVNATVVRGSVVYAATQDGLKTADLNTNIQDYRNWNDDSYFKNDIVTGIYQADYGMVAKRNDSLFINSSGTSWQPFYSDGWTISDLSFSGEMILLSENSNVSGRIVVINRQAAVQKLISDPVFTAAPKGALLVDGRYWIADSTAGLSVYNGSSFEDMNPVSPFSIANGAISSGKNSILATAGAVTASWQPEKNRNGLFVFSDRQWKNYNGITRTALNSFTDVITVAQDTRTGTIWAGSFGKGLAKIESNGKITLFALNSFIHADASNPGSYRVSGLAIDNDGILWIANYGASQNLIAVKQDGTDYHFRIPFSIPGNAVSEIITDDENQKWIIIPGGKGLICFNSGGSIENEADDQWIWYRSGTSAGSLPSDSTLCIAKDKQGFIWVGTSSGIGIIQCPGLVFSSQGCKTIIPVVRQGDFNGYLFASERAQAIAVDGADRKWIGTRNGVWLISADGEQTISRYTTENSPLPDNDIKGIAIDDQTGEVFFSTGKGICSLRGIATEKIEENASILVFPNPVPPGYNGLIAIKGLPENSIVRITETNGRLVYETRAKGSQAVWNGKDYRGRDIASGIYMVLISDASGRENISTKIVFLSK